MPAQDDEEECSKQATGTSSGGTKRIKARSREGNTSSAPSPLRVDPEIELDVPRQSTAANPGKAASLVTSRQHVVVVGGVVRPFLPDHSIEDRKRLVELAVEVRDGKVQAKLQEALGEAKMRGVDKEIRRLNADRLRYPLEVDSWRSQTWRDVNVHKSRSVRQDSLHYVAPERRRHLLRGIERRRRSGWVPSLGEERRPDEEDDTILRPLTSRGSLIPHPSSFGHTVSHRADFLQAGSLPRSARTARSCAAP